MYFLKITKGRKPKSNSISMKLGKLIISDPLLLLVLDIEYRQNKKNILNTQKEILGPVIKVF